MKIRHLYPSARFLLVYAMRTRNWAGARSSTRSVSRSLSPSPRWRWPGRRRARQAESSSGGGNRALVKNVGTPHSGGHFHTFPQLRAQNTSIQGVLPSLRHKLDGSWN